MENLGEEEEKKEKEMSGCGYSFCRMLEGGIILF